MSEEVVFSLRGLKLIRHPHPLFLVGSDVLSGGRGSGQWNYSGVALDTSDTGDVTGKLCFTRDGVRVEERLVNVPTAKGSHSAGTKSVSMVGLVGGPPSGGQCLWRTVS